MKTEQKDKPLVIFPKRRQHSGRTFQFSINTKKFQRVLEANPLEVLQFSKSNNTQERDKRKSSNNTISQMQTQKYVTLALTAETTLMFQWKQKIDTSVIFFRKW